MNLLCSGISSVMLRCDILVRCYDTDMARDILKCNMLHQTLIGASTYIGLQNTFYTLGFKAAYAAVWVIETWRISNVCVCVGDIR